MAELVERVFRKAFSNSLLDQGNDQARFAMPAGDLVMSTDSFVVSPLFFPGGDIGSLAVHGTVNDLAMGGAEALYLSAGFILEEGLPLSDLERIVASMATAARQAGVQIVTGDTKVVERGKGDGVFVNTTGIGRVLPGIEVSGDRARPGDRIILSGTIGDHGVAVMMQREGLNFTAPLESDSAPLNGLVSAMAAVRGSALRALRDPTRGGVAATLNELARQSAVGMHIDERSLPIRDAVRGACELLGLDALNVANEGKLLAIVAAEAADELVACLRADPLGAEACVIGEVVEDPRSMVRLRTPVGGERVVDWLYGEQLPRIC